MDGYKCPNSRVIRLRTEDYFENALGSTKNGILGAAAANIPQKLAVDFLGRAAFDVEELDLDVDAPQTFYTLAVTATF